jgi:hypothetical protein
MIPAPVGWGAEILQHGMAFTHPEGREVASIFYRERARPLQRVGTLVRHILSHLTGFKAETIGPPERLVTFDGEHAALVSVTGTEGGNPAQRDFGFVFGDDFFSSVGGLCYRADLRAEIKDLVRDLVMRDVHGLGVRRRRFEYEPPRGWQPLARGLATEWLPPDYPRNSTTIMVYPANPSGITEAVTLEQAVAFLVERGHVIEQKDAPVAVTTASGLAGMAQTVRARPAQGPSRLLETVLLADVRYTYALELTSHDPARWGSHRELLARLVHSIAPVPAPSRRLAAAGVMSHWLG